MSLLRFLMGNTFADTVTIRTTNYQRGQTNPICYSGVKFDADGNQYARQSNGGWSSLGSWLVKGSAGNYYIQRTVNAGTLTTDGGDGVLLSTDRIYDVQQTINGVTTPTVEVMFSISTDAPGTTVVAGPKNAEFSSEVTGIE